MTGDGGLAVTRFRVGRPPTVVFATAALTGLSPAAVHSLAAHELAHVIRRERSSAAGRYVWLAGYLVLMVAGAGLSVTALATAPQLGGLALMATLATAVAFLGIQVAFDRREEIAADLFAGQLTHDLDAAAELMRFLDEHVTRPEPDGRVRSSSDPPRATLVRNPPTGAGAARCDAQPPGSPARTVGAAGPPVTGEHRGRVIRDAWPWLDALACTRPASRSSCGTTAHADVRMPRSGPVTAGDDIFTGP